MKIERTKNASKSISAGLLLKLYQMIAPFFMRTMMIWHMGVQYTGLNSLFSAVLHILNLTELGVGAAMVFSMYKPIAENDHPTICALLNLYRKYYRIIGLVVAAIGLALTPAIPHLISGEVPAGVDLYVLYLLNLAATVLSYWLFAYKNSLLQAHQQNYVSSIVLMVTTTIQYAGQLVVILWLKNYYLYLIVALLSQVLTNVVTAIVATKMYPQYKPRGALSVQQTKTINRKIRDLFTGKLGSVIVGSADTVVISAFLGLSLLTTYQNYYFILKSVLSIIEIILQSVTAGLGNSYVTETKEKYYSDLKKFTFLFLWLIGVCTCCFLGLYQPFIRRWVGSKLVLDFSIVVCFVCYFYVYCFNRLLNIYKDAAGIFHADRFRPLVTALANLVMNLLLVNYWGLYGVILSTVLSQVLIGVPWLLRNLFTLVFDREQLKDYLKQVISLTAVVAVSAAITLFFCHLMPEEWYMTMVARGIICLCIPNAVLFILLRKHKLFRPCVQMVDRLTGNKLRFENKLFRGK